jgi:superfamily II DNA/RNA helicase
MIKKRKEEELMDLVLDMSIEDPTIDICEPDDVEFDFLPGLQHDLKLHKELSAEWEKVNEDPKLDVFIEYLKNTLLSKSINPESKLVVFSESKETAEYLEKELPKHISASILSVDNKTIKDRMPNFCKNFDAHLPKFDQEYNYTIILTTIVLAEGINLHLSNVIVNDDTPWNSTGLMQRISRVNRIVSTVDEVHVYNFYPTATVNNDIELEKKAKMKLQSFHAALGEDRQIYSPDEETETFGLFDKEMEEEKDEKLAYLMMIRDIKEKTPDVFKQRDAFIMVNDNEEIEELTSLETVKIFVAEELEKAIPSHSKHCVQVQVGILLFSDLPKKEKAKDKKIDTTQGANEKKANAYLDAMRNLPLVNEKERALIIKAKEALRQGRFQNLQRNINKFQRTLKKFPLKPAIIFEKVMEMLRGYPLMIEVAKQELEKTLLGLRT